MDVRPTEPDVDQRQESNMAYRTRKPEIRPPYWILDYWTLIKPVCVGRAPPENMGIANKILRTM